MRVHILDDWFDTLRHLPCFAKLAKHEVTVWNDHLTDPAPLAKRLMDAEVLVLFRERTPITRDLIAKLPKLKLISQRSVYPHIDVDACTDHKVLLCSRLGDKAVSHAAAEMTWALVLAAMRDLPKQMASVKAGTWQAGVGKSLYGRQIGLFGYGRIGKVVAEYARAFSMGVVWWGSEAGRGRATAAGEIVAASREAFFAESDIVSLHIRLNDATRASITGADLAVMKPSSVLVNTSRAGLIAPGALLAGLQQGRPGVAAIDVFDEEPLHDKNDALLAHPNLIATPHIGYVTEDELEVQFADIFDQINAYAEGSPIHMVNPEVWGANAKTAP